MAEDRPGHVHRGPAGSDRRVQRPRGRVMKPANWPRHMREKLLASGHVGYFWAPPTRAIKAGFTITSEPLGTDYGAACDRAKLLNRHLDDWRDGRGAEKSLDMRPGVGT